MAGKWHLVADVAKTLAQTYGSTSSVCGAAFCGIQCTSWELFGNSLGTLRELLGTVWELCGTSSRTFRELCGNKGIYLTMLYCILYKYGRIYYIVNTMCYTCVLYRTHTLYSTNVLYKEKSIPRASTLLVYSTSASPLTIIMGQSFPRWELCWEYWSNIFYINIAFGLLNVAQAST
jgi:hypothetical protein